jgi:hypothetical protein
MDTTAIEELLDEMFSSLEDLETKAAATLLFLKDKGHATDQDLAPYLEQAGNASNVRWRAARLRMMSLLSSAVKNFEAAKQEAKPSTAVAKNAEAKTEEAKQTEAGTDEERTAEAEKTTGIKEEQRRSSQPKDSPQKQNPVESAKAAEPASREDKVPSADEHHASTTAQDPASKSAPSSPEEAAKTPPSGERNVPQKSKEDAA